jgi:hypothetical protein
MTPRSYAASLAFAASLLTSSALAQTQPWDERKPAPVVALNVAPDGDDAGDGSAAHPFRTLERAQAAVRSRSAAADVIVTLADGIYRLDKPLVFRVEDGGQEGHMVTWRAAPGAHPVISGGVAVTQWQLHDKARGLYVARVPAGTDARQIWVDDRLAPRARIAVDRAKVTFDTQGVTLPADVVASLRGIDQPDRLEVEGTGFFTNRVAVVQAVRGNRLEMKQPGWINNIWGYDTISKPVSPEHARLFLANALPLVREAGQWYLDPRQGRLYLKSPAGADPARMRVELPRLDHLVSISGTPERPVRDLTFTGLRFSHTSWLGPSSPEGYANQQSGAYLTGATAGYPADPIGTCSWGCRTFETRRNDWAQIPAAVQVSAAERVTFDGNVFAHLGQVGIGIGNDAATHASGTGLGARSIVVSRNVFTDLAAGAIVAGGIGRSAHHPADPRLADRNITISNNRIRSVSKVFKDNSAVLSTYVDNALILHNDISDVPYDAIDIGWGWGLNDQGGNPIYRIAERGYYDHPANLIYETPTLHRNTIVAYNRIHGAKQLFEDGGAIYNLSASPGTVIAENHVFDIPGKIALYLDEGSKHIVVRDNVVDGAGRWLNDNTVKASHPLRVTYGNRATGNWHNSEGIGGVWDAYGDNLILDDHPVKGSAWPADARRVIDNAGIEAKAGPVAYGDAAGR